MAVLIDRSKDSFHGERLCSLAPSSVFVTTENYGRLSSKLLSRYDALVLFGNSTARYTKAELDAVKAFVRRGGGLVIAACSGAFEHATGRPVEDLAANVVARLFGFRFLSAAELPTNLDAVRGSERSQLELTAAGEKLGLRLGEIPLSRPGPVSVPRGATTLMRQKKAGSAVCALRRFGRGRVLVCNDTALWDHWMRWATPHWLMAVAPKKRVATAPLPDTIDPRRWEETRRGRIVVRHAPLMQRRAAQVIDLAQQVYGQLSRMLKPSRKLRRWRIQLGPGCGEAKRDEDEHEVGSAIGNDLSEAAMVGVLARHLGYQFLGPKMRHVFRQYVHQAIFYLEIRVLETLGFRERAGKLRRAMAGGPRVDLVRLYCYEPWARVARYKRFWLDLADEFGDDALSRFLEAIPEGDPHKGIDNGVFDGFEVLAFYLATALGERAYDWLESQGHSIRRVPLEAPGSPELLGATKKLLGKIISDPGEPASRRFDALSALAVRLSAEGVSLSTCLRAAKSGSAATALPAAARVLMARDRRGLALARPWLKDPDPGLAATAALLMVFETRDAGAADVLARLAGKQDTRFQLSAGHALRLAGHPQADRFAFSKVKGCRLKVVEDGEVRVFPVVDGYEVANVFCLPMFVPDPFGQAHSSYYVSWVLTDARWRRRGLARRCLERALKHRWDRLCATTSLGTGVRNVAHALYRSFGLIDYQRGISFTKALREEPPVKPPRGIRVRRARREDAAAATELLNAHLEAQAWERCRLMDWPGSKVAWVAYQGEQCMGVATASVSGRHASLEHIAVAEVKDKSGKPVGELRALLGHALLNAAHRDLLRRKATTVQTHGWLMPITDGVAWALRRQGYGSKQTGGVGMRRINDLAQYLDEIAPVLERRLADSERWAAWQGSILIEGARLMARLEIDSGKVRALPHRPQKAGRTARRKASDDPMITIQADDLAIQRMAFGIEHPFEEYLQLNATVTPHLNDSARDLLEILFPKLIPE